MATARATRSTEAPVLLLWIGVILANLSNAGRTWHIPMLAAACGPGGSLAFLLAVGLLLARTQAAGVSGGGLVMAGLAAALVANALVSLNELGQLGPPMSPPAVPVEDAGGGLAVLVRSMATAPADLMLRALSRLLYAAASVRWLSEIRPISWSSAAALGVIPSAALISCAQLAIDSAASAAAVMRQPSEGSHASHGAPLVVRAPLEQDPNFGGVTLDAIGAAVLAGACSLRVATAWFAPRSRRLPTPNGAAAAALVPASQAIEEARQLRAKLGALLPLAVAAAFALFTALGRLSFPPAALGEPGVHKSAHGAGARGAAAVVPEGSLGWMSALEGADWAAWVRLSRVLLDAAAALAVVRLANLAAQGGGAGGQWASWGGSSHRSLADLQAEKERILRERRARAPVIQDADGDEWEPYHGEQLARLDPSLVRDEDGDFAHEFWRAVPTGGFERAQVPGSGKAQQAAESKPAS